MTFFTKENFEKVRTLYVEAYKELNMPVVANNIKNDKVWFYISFLKDEHSKNLFDANGIH